MAVLDFFVERLQHEHDAEQVPRDLRTIARALPVAARYTRLFSPEVHGVENIPATGPVLVVGNHSGLYYMPDVWITAQAIVARRGPTQAAYGLAYDLLFAVPVLGDFLRHVGALPADPAAAERVLGEGALVLVYPGGDWEACRPWSQRDHVDLAGHSGFVRLALRTGVPVVPVVAHGAHDTVLIVNRGERVARTFGLDRLHVKVFPIMVGPPWGLTTALLPPLPMPTAVTVEFLPSMRWSEIDPRAAEDPDVVASCYGELVDMMQTALEGLRAADPHPLRRGVTQLARRVAGRLH